MLEQPSKAAQPAGPAIGILCLDEPPYEPPGAGGIYDPALYPWALLRETVPGATVEAILSADPALVDPYVETAKSLRTQGAGIIISNCGFTIAYDAVIRRSLPVPVATSSLLLLPFLSGLLKPGEKIGILTFDAEKLTQEHLAAAWPGMDADTLALGGLENTRCWSDVIEHGRYDWREIEEESLRTLDRLLKRNPDVAFVIVECCALCAYVPAYRARAGRPVFDIVSLANFLLGAERSGGQAETEDTFRQPAGTLAMPQERLMSG